MKNKPLTASDLVVGKKYVPHSKSVGDFYLLSQVLDKMRQSLIPYLTYLGEINGGFSFCVGNNKSYTYLFLPSDVTPYTEPNQTTMNTDYLEQPFNLETALKHPEWVRTRNGIEIDFIKEYPDFNAKYTLSIALKDGNIFKSTKDGIYIIGETSKFDLILHVPHVIKWANLNDDKTYTLHEGEQAANLSAETNRIYCVQVKIPAI